MSDFDWTLGGSVPVSDNLPARVSNDPDDEVVEAELLEEVEPVEPFYADPQVKHLLSIIGDLTRQIEELTAARREPDLEWDAAKAEREGLMAEVNVKLARIAHRMREADAQRKEFDRKISEMIRVKDQALAGIEDLRRQRELEEAAQAVEKKWQDTINAMDFEWLEAIRDFQMRALRFVIEAWNDDMHGVLIADQMGLGKTLEAGAAIDVLQGLEDYAARLQERVPTIHVDKPEARCVIWLCPSLAKASTMRELQKWGRENTAKLEGDKEMRKRIVRLTRQFGLTLVVGYEQLRDRGDESVTQELLEYEWPIVVMDEAHRFKNPNSSTFKNVEKMAKQAAFVIPMTGTPLLNKPNDFWAILHMLTLKGKYKGKFHDLRSFIRQYCIAYGSKVRFYNEAYFVSQVEDMVIGRKKDDVLLELPPKLPPIYYEVQHGRAQADVYDTARDYLRLWMDEQKSDYIPITNFLAQCTYLRQINLYPAGVTMRWRDPETGEPREQQVTVTESAKLDKAMELIEEMMDNDEKVLVFSNYNAPLVELEKRVLAAKFEFNNQPVGTAIIKGGVGDEDRMDFQDRFNDPEDGSCAVLFGNIAAMGQSLNLQGAASNCIFLDLFWTPGINEQAEDRLHRQGQQNAVQVHIIHGESTIDNYIQKIINDKKNMIDGVINRNELRKMIDDGDI